MTTEVARRPFIKEAYMGLGSPEQNMTYLAKRLGKKRYGNWNEVFLEEERSLMNHGLGGSILDKLNEFKNLMAEKAMTSVNMPEHAISFVIYGKKPGYKYGLYTIDGVLISFPSAYNNENMIFLLKGDSRYMSVRLPQEQKDKMISDIENDVEFLNRHFDLGLELQQAQWKNGGNSLSIKVPEKTKVS